MGPGKQGRWGGHSCPSSQADRNVRPTFPLPGICLIEKKEELQDVSAFIQLCLCRLLRTSRPEMGTNGFSELGRLKRKSGLADDGRGLTVLDNQAWRVSDSQLSRPGTNGATTKLMSCDR